MTRSAKGTTQRLIVAVAMAAALAGCAGPARGMRELAPDYQMNTTPPPGKAAVVFMRPSTLGFAIASSVYELKPGGDVFIGIVPAKRKVVHFADPGSTRFMVVSEAADFMGAELEAGKTYYALVTPRMGMWKARFSLRPVTHADREFSEWLSGCTWIENTPASEAWAKENWSDIQAKKLEYTPKWEKKPEKPILRATDAR